MNGTVYKTPIPGRESLFFQDLTTPVSTRRAKFSSPGQAAVVSTLWRENVGASDLPSPPAFTLDDQNDFTTESGIPEYTVLGSPEVKSDPRTPIQGFGHDFSTPSKGKSEATTLYALSSGKQLQTQNSTGSASWWSPTTTSDALNSGKQVQTQKNWWPPTTTNSGEQVQTQKNWCSPTITADEAEEKEKVSPVKGVVEAGALLMLPPPRDVARPEIQRNSLPAGNLD